MSHLRATVGHLIVTVGHPMVTIGHLRVTSNSSHFIAFSPAMDTCSPPSQPRQQSLSFCQRVHSYTPHWKLKQQQKRKLFEWKLQLQLKVLLKGILKMRFNNKNQMSNFPKSSVRIFFYLCHCIWHLYHHYCRCTLTSLHLRNSKLWPKIHLLVQ